jgi:hypothetical protein
MANTKSLTKKEQYYFNVMSSGNTLFLKAKPATAKSSMLRSIADKMGYQYIDIRLSTADETDFSIPNVVQRDGIPVTQCSVPMWAIKANEKKTIIHFEEINVCRKEIQDAALGVFLERIVGEYHLNPSPDVLICTSGNLGEEDGTNADDLSSALINRMIVVKHDLTVDEWISEFAQEHVHSDIVSFVKSFPEYFYRKGNDDQAQYATCRSWTFLSNYIQTVFGKNAPSDKWISDVSEHGTDFIGTSIIRFIRYIEDQSVFNINDVINNYGTVRDNVLKAGRAKLDELLVALKEKDIHAINKKQMNNIVSFLKDNKDNMDAVGGYLEHVLSNISAEDMTNDTIKILMSNMSDYADVIQKALNI